MAGSLSSEDRIEVMQLIGSSAHYNDTSDLESYVATYAPDGEFRSADGSSSHKGPELREWMGQLMTSPRAVPKALHFMGLPHIEGNSERCTARTYVVWIRQADDGSVSVPGIAFYDDTCVKVDGRWVFQTRSSAPLIGSFAGGPTKT